MQSREYGDNSDSGVKPSIIIGEDPNSSFSGDTSAAFFIFPRSVPSPTNPNHYSEDIEAPDSKIKNNFNFYGWMLLLIILAVKYFYSTLLLAPLYSYGIIVVSIAMEASALEEESFGSKRSNDIIIQAVFRILGLYFFCITYCPQLLLGPYTFWLKFAAAIFMMHTLQRVYENKDYNLFGIVNMFPVLILSLGYLLYFNGFGLFGDFGWLSLTVFYAFFVITGLYEVEDRKIMNATFDLGLWPRCFLGFGLGLMYLFVNNISVIDVSNLILAVSPTSALLCLFVSVPIIFNKVIVEEYFFRSSVLYAGSYKLGSGLFFILATLVTIIFTYTYAHNFGIGFMALITCFAVKLPLDLACMFISSLTGGVEYSSGINFAINLIVLSVCPFMSLSLSTWYDLGTTFLKSTGASILVVAPILAVESYFASSGKFDYESLGGYSSDTSMNKDSNVNPTNNLTCHNC